MTIEYKLPIYITVHLRDFYSYKIKIPEQCVRFTTYSVRRRAQVFVRKFRRMLAHGYVTLLFIQQR
jgi:hypothetical protein